MKNNYTLNIGNTIALLLMVLTVSTRGDANPPDRINYQGYLVDATGTPLGASNPQNYDTLFRIYTASSAGTLLWTEQQTVTVDKGYFSILLGEGSAYGSEAHGLLSSIFASSTASDRYIGISVKLTTGGSYTEITPRLRLVASPYAMLAKSTTQLLDSSGNSTLSATSTTLSSTKALSVSGAVTATGFNLSGQTGLSAATVTSGTFATSLIPSLDAAKITTGTFASTLVPNLDASKITTGALSTNQIPSLDASKIASGTVADARLSANVAKLNANATFTGTVTATTFSGFGVIPVGGIIMWSGSSATIPSGWVLCDGLARTVGSTTVTPPDLRNRFIIGAGSTYNPGNTGGSTTVTLTTANLPAHGHTYKDTYHAESTLAKGDGINGHDTVTATVGSYSTDTDNIYLFYRNLTTSNTGTGTAVTTMPPYYALCFIMRVQ